MNNGFVNFCFLFCGLFVCSHRHGHYFYCFITPIPVAHGLSTARDSGPQFAWNTIAKLLVEKHWKTKILLLPPWDPCPLNLSWALCLCVFGHLIFVPFLGPRRAYTQRECRSLPIVVLQEQGTNNRFHFSHKRKKERKRRRRTERRTEKSSFHVLVLVLSSPWTSCLFNKQIIHLIPCSSSSYYFWILVCVCVQFQR